MYRLFFACMAVTLTAPAVCSEDFETALETAREAARQHRYDEVIEILAPHSTSDDREIQYITAAEMGRAYFHLGRYQAANRAFREAVTLHPERPETALYLEATSYLTGDTRQAFLIFEEFLRSSATDLYLAVTLPGSRQFLAEPEVQALLDEFSTPLSVNSREASALGVSLGDHYQVVIDRLGASASEAATATLTAAAGPAVIWAFAFDDEQRLSEIVLHAGHLLDYTPYRLRFAVGIDWSATPAAAIAAWGPPGATHAEPDNRLTMSWFFEDHDLSIDFGAPEAFRPPGLPEGSAMIRMVSIRKSPPTRLDRIDP